MRFLLLFLLLPSLLCAQTRVGWVEGQAPALNKLLPQTPTPYNPQILLQPFDTAQQAREAYDAGELDALLLPLSDALPLSRPSQSLYAIFNRGTNLAVLTPMGVQPTGPAWLVGPAQGDGLLLQQAATQHQWDQQGWAERESINRLPEDSRIRALVQRRAVLLVEGAETIQAFLQQGSYLLDRDATAAPACGTLVLWVPQDAPEHSMRAYQNLANQWVQLLRRWTQTGPRMQLMRPLNPSQRLFWEAAYLPEDLSSISQFLEDLDTHHLLQANGSTQLFLRAP